MPVPKVFFYINLIIFVLRVAFKIPESKDNHFREKSNNGRRRDKTLIIVATTFCLQCPRAVHALRLDQQILPSPILIMIYCHCLKSSAPYCDQSY